MFDKPSGLITLTTDFGLDHVYVGEMKGVLAEIAPQSRIIDLTHSITPHSITEGCFVIGHSFKYFPPGTVHVIVVDPSVGSDRRILCARTENYLFLAPDNGVLSMVLQRDRPLSIIDVTNRRFLPQGLDIFSEMPRSSGRQYC